MQRRLSPELKKSIALQAISGSNVTQLAQNHQVCRNTVYSQKLLAQTAVNEVFLESAPNDQVFLRSQHDYMRGRTPAEVLTGTSHPNWLEMLGFQRFKKAA